MEGKFKHIISIACLISFIILMGLIIIVVIIAIIDKETSFLYALIPLGFITLMIGYFSVYIGRLKTITYNPTSGEVTINASDKDLFEMDEQLRRKQEQLALTPTSGTPPSVEIPENTQLQYLRTQELKKATEHTIKALELEKRIRGLR